MILIHEYSDYRKYLKDHFQAGKAVNKNFSFRYLAWKAGINSSGFFKLILEGKRNLTSETILKTCKAFDLNAQDSEYFEALVKFNQADSMKKKNIFFEELIELQKRRNFEKIPEDRYDYFGEWYHCIIRELAVILDFKENYRTLANAVIPKITPSQAKASVKLLLKLGFLKKEKSGYMQSSPIVSTGQNIKSHQIKKYQVEMLKKSIEVFDRQKEESRIMSCNTLAISEKNFEHFAERLREFRTQILNLAEDENNADVVYLLNLNLFPSSKQVKL